MLLPHVHCGEICAFSSFSSSLHDTCRSASNLAARNVTDLALTTHLCSNTITTLFVLFRFFALLCFCCTITSILYLVSHPMYHHVLQSRRQASHAYTQPAKILTFAVLTSRKYGVATVW